MPTTEQGIKDKTVECVHDGASIKKQMTANKDWEDVGCSALKLHLCVTALLESIKWPTQHYRSWSALPCLSVTFPIVWSHHRSWKLSGGDQKGRSASEVNSLCTWWNSVYDTFEHLQVETSYTYHIYSRISRQFVATRHWGSAYMQVSHHLKWDWLSLFTSIYGNFYTLANNDVARSRLISQAT